MCVSRKFVFHAFFMGLILMEQMLPLRPHAAEGGALAPSSTFQFIYIDANVGGSSGGHSALRINNTVYHFQYFPDGLFKLVRERWPHFRYIYNDLENRTLYVAHIHVAVHDLMTIREHLDRIYLIQEAHMARLAALNADVQLLCNLNHGHRQISVNGAGFFSFTASPDKISARLQLTVINAYGEDYLTNTIKNLDLELLNTPLVVPHMKDFKIARETYPLPVSSLSKKYVENRLKRTALRVLDQGLPLREDELTDMDHFLRPGDRKGLTQNERNKLSAYAESLKASVIRLASSDRPDWGYPLLLASARYQAVMWSLKHDRLFLLDPFPCAAKYVSAKTIQEDPTVTAQLAHRAWRTYRDVRKETFAGKALEERTYNRLEESAGRFAELEKGRVTGKAIRVAYGRLIPNRSHAVPLPSPIVSQQIIMQSLKSACSNRDIYGHKLKRCYPYHLIGNNCATELIRNLNASFQLEHQNTGALGGNIVPGEDMSFIPFRLFDLVKDRFRVDKVMVLPGFRKRRLARMAQNEPQNTDIYFRECNTLTSTLYHRVKGDTPFLFFTDDVVWIRPAFGAINTVYGLLTAIAGIFTLPLDGGQLSLEGLKGCVYSLPEIFFFNIRKGSFNYVDDPADSQIKTLERSAPAFDRRVYP